MALSDWYVNAVGQLVPRVFQLMDAWNVHAISAGEIDLSFGLIKVAAESGSADDLVTINDGVTGHFVVLKADTGDTITVKHNTGNIYCPDDTDFVLTAASGNILALVYDGDDSKWKPLGFPVSGGGGVTDISAAIYMDTAQSVGAGATGVLVDFDGIDYDSDSMVDFATYPGRITFNTAGKYAIDCGLNYQNYTDSTNRSMQVWLYDSGGTSKLIFPNTVRNISGVPPYLKVSAQIEVAAGDYMEVTTSNSAAVARTLTERDASGNTYCYLQVHKFA